MINALGGLGPAALARPIGFSDGGAAGFHAQNPVSSFAAALGAMAHDTVGTLKGAESTSLQALQGKADTREVVDAVMGAEQALQTAVGIRDKIVSAFLEVSHMAI